MVGPRRERERDAQVPEEDQLAQSLGTDQCPECGRFVKNFFDHIAMDCTEMSDEEVSEELLREELQMLATRDI